MPSSLIAEMERGGAVTTPTGGLDEQRAIQLALELSMLGLPNDDDGQLGDLRAKKSMNTTECVPVPSSEHVAEIVGRQGCKIKALRAKTNTYIKTPVRGEEPVFVVTGRKEDVGAAKREIQQAADHFSQIRATRRNSATLSTSSLGPPSPTTPGQVTKQVRVPYRVVGLVVGPKGATIKRIQQATNTYIVTPSRDKEPVFEVTGLPDNVEKARQEIEHHIALRTGGMSDLNGGVANGICLPDSNGDGFSNGSFSTGLFSPSSHGSFSAFLDQNHPSAASHHHHHLQHHQRSQSIDSYPYFSGSSGSSKFSDLSSGSSPFSNNGFFYDGIIPSPNGDLESPPNSAFDPAPGSLSGSIWPDLTTRQNQINRAVGSQPVMPRSNSLGMIGNPTNHQEQRSSSPPCGSPLQYGTRSLSGGSLNDGLSPIFSTTYSSFNRSVGGSTTASSGSSTTLSSTTDTIKQSLTSVPQPPSSNGSASESERSSPGPMATGWNQTEITVAMGNNNNNNNSLNGGRKNCFYCSDNEVTAALIPCGHNLFCMECANRVREEVGECPACHQQVKQVLRIFT